MKLLRVTLPFALASFAWAQQPGQLREIAVDLRKPTTPHSAMPLMTVCAGRANEGLRADWQTQMNTMQREIGFGYLRFHGLLHDDMGIYAEDAKGRPSYNFAYVDTLYDAMLAAHLRPFVEFSFMPGKLASGTRTVFWWKGNITPPRDMAKWNSLIRALMEHWRERYGADEVARWYFEVWNEPDLPGFWSGTERQYFDLYRNTAETVKAVCPHCRVGGPASAVRGLEARWLDFVANEHVPADFLSTHAYGVLGQAFTPEGKAVVTTGDPIERVRGTRALLDGSALPGLELHYTEWNSRYSSTHPIHDQYISAPFILEKLREGNGLLQSMAYWTFTDIFEEDGPRLAPFHGGFGLMTLQGLRKPAYFAYKYLAELGPDDLSTQDKESWVTRKPDGSVQALFWNYTPALPPAGVAEEAFYRQEQPAADAGPVLFSATGLRNGRYTVKQYSVGHRRNDAYTAYLDMGSPANLTREQLAGLERSTADAPVAVSEVEIRDGHFEQRVALEQNQAVLLLLQPR